jgi:hypothetical protein
MSMDAREQIAEALKAVGLRWERDDADCGMFNDREIGELADAVEGCSAIKDALAADGFGHTVSQQRDHWREQAEILSDRCEHNAGLVEAAEQRCDRLVEALREAKALTETEWADEAANRRLIGQVIAAALAAVQEDDRDPT